MYKVSAGLRSTRNHDGAVILDIPRGRVLRLNATGSLIFGWVEQGQPEAEIIDGLVQRFRISREVAQADVMELLRSLEQEGLLRNEPSRSCP